MNNNNLEQSHHNAYKNVFYIYDEHRKYLKSGSKTSPIDYGIDVFLFVPNWCDGRFCQ